MISNKKGPHTTYFHAKEQRTTAFACNQFIGKMPAFENESICSFKMPHYFMYKLTKCHATVTYKKEF